MLPYGSKQKGSPVIKEMSLLLHSSRTVVQFIEVRQQIELLLDKELSYCTSDSDKIKVLKKCIDCLLLKDHIQ